MTETLTESFCERCGTRYEFSAPTRLNPLRKTRGLIGGLKNYLTSQDALSDAIGDAMRDEEGALATAQLEAFHESFNFCIDCRQYTCLNCWNDDAGRCRSCAPIAGTDDLVERLEASLALEGGTAAVPGPAMAEEDLQRRLGLEAWPTSDLPEPATNGHVPVDWPVVETPAEPAPQVFIAADGFAYESQAQVDAVNARLEQEAARAEEERLEALAEADRQAEAALAQAGAEAAARAEAERLAAALAEEERQAAALAELATPPAPVEPDWEAVAAELALEQAAAVAEPVVAETADVEQAERPPLRVVAWDEDAAYDTVEPEPMVAEVAPEPEPEPMVAEVAPEPEPEPMVAEVAPEPEPEPMVAEVGPERTPRPIAPISETILRFPDRPEPSAAPERVAAEADSPELAARRAQLDLLGLGDPGEGPLTPETPTVLPYRSSGAAATPAELAALAAQGARFWEASAREVASAVGNVGLQNCGQCGLSLSANARFCRRCGTRQARSA